MVSPIRFHTMNWTRVKCPERFVKSIKTEYLEFAVIGLIGRMRHFVDDHSVIEIIEIVQDFEVFSLSSVRLGRFVFNQNDRNGNRRNARNPFKKGLWSC